MKSKTNLDGLFVGHAIVNFTRKFSKKENKEKFKNPALVGYGLRHAPRLGSYSNLVDLIQPLLVYKIVLTDRSTINR